MRFTLGGVAVLLLLLLTSTLLPVAAAPQAAGAPVSANDDPPSLSGTLIPLRVGDTDTPSYIPPPPPPQGPTAQAATITVSYDGFTPEAQAAFQYAVDIWKVRLTSPVEIRVMAEWVRLEQPDVLGQAGPFTFVRDFRGAPQPQTYYPVALANELAGRDLDPTNPDIVAVFNSSFSNFYFGTDGRPPTGKVDFVTVVLHELGHGLGFVGSMRVDSTTDLGSYGDSAGVPFIYDRFAQGGVAGQLLLSYPNNSTELASRLQSDDVFFNGSNAIEGNKGAYPRLWAPAPFEPGSSYSHLGEQTYLPGDPNSLMTPALNSAEAIHDPGPITLGMFRDMGWAVTPGSSPTPTPTAPTSSPTPTPTAPTSSPTAVVDRVSRAFLPVILRTRTASW